mgnify:CR=1 FL=1
MRDSTSSIAGAAAVWLEPLASLTDKLIGVVVCSGSDRVVGANVSPVAATASWRPIGEAELNITSCHVAQLPHG